MLFAKIVRDADKLDVMDESIDRYDFKDEGTKLRMEEIRKNTNEYVENNL